MERSARELFNWGFHDGQLDVVKRYGIRRRDYGTSSCGPLPKGSHFKPYRKGYMEGVVRARIAGREDSSADAWTRYSRLADPGHINIYFH